MAYLTRKTFQMFPQTVSLHFSHFLRSKTYINFAYERKTFIKKLTLDPSTTAAPVQKKVFHKHKYTNGFLLHKKMLTSYQPYHKSYPNLRDSVLHLLQNINECIDYALYHSGFINTLKILNARDQEAPQTMLNQPCLNKYFHFTRYLRGKGYRRISQVGKREKYIHRPHKLDHENS